MEALPDVPLDAAILRASRMEALVEISPPVQDRSGASPRDLAPEQLSIAERFRRAYAEREERETVRALKVQPAPRHGT